MIMSLTNLSACTLKSVLELANDSIPLDVANSVILSCFIVSAGEEMYALYDK